MKKLLLFYIFVVCFNLGVKSQTFYELNTIQTIEIYFSQPNWDYMMDTAKQGAEGYIIAQWVRVNGVNFDSVGVKYKGNSSYNPTRKKNPLHIELDYVIDEQNYDGYTDIKLGNAFKDPSFIREVLSYEILRNYMAAPLSNYANVYINDDYIGLYSNAESITKKFVDKHFYSKQNPFFKCNPVYSTNGKSNLAYLGADSSLYFNSYEIKSEIGWKALVELCDILKNDIGNINSVLDIDRVLWMLAFDNIFVNLDSYIGGITQNYYLYKSDNGSFNPIIWDLNESFGCFNNTGEGPPLNLLQMQQMPPFLHLTNNNWPLIQKLLNISLYNKMYIAHMKTIFNEFINNDLYIAMADSLRNMIDATVMSDTNKLYSYVQFQNAMNSNITTGMFIPGITVLMNARKTYLNGINEFQYQQPQIALPVISDTMPQVNDSITITVSVQNAVVVQLGYRSSIYDRFKRKQMYDDGLHGDGSAADGIYGLKIPVVSSQTHFYVYAENANAGCFLPERAEYEYLTVNSDIQYINFGQLVINELMAINSTTIVDNYNQYSDWIELYNNTTDTLNLTNLFLSDNFSVPYKWKFPDNTKIAPHGYLLVWANDDTTSYTNNASFKLSGSGERVILSYDNGAVIDSISFPQQISDISYGRYPNGTGNFVIMPPTPLQSNTISSIHSIEETPAIKLFPIPVNELLNIESANTAINNIDLYDAIGRHIFSKEIGERIKYQLDTEHLKAGIYILIINGIYIYKIVK